MADEERGPSVSRAEFERLLRRVAELEARLAPPPPPPPAAPAYAPAGPPAATPAAARDPPRAAPAYAPAGPAAAARPRAASLETAVGARFAPRVGALLVFLATLFFLGLAVQRGWIGPLAQLAIAAGTGFALVGAAEWLASRKGYGQYPQVLQGLGACILYATAFVAYALPYYQRETRLTEVGGGVLLALVAAFTVGLAVWRNARVVASLGFALSFLTAGIGWGVLPALTLPYVSILGAALAALVAWKGWREEALVGTLATGGFFVFFAIDAYRPPPEPWLVVACAMLPAAAFFALTLGATKRPASANDLPLTGSIAFLTLAWASVASLAPFWRDRLAIGLVLFAWSAVAVALAFLARRSSDRRTVVAYGVGAVLLYLVAAPFAWWEADERAFAITATYAVGALALALAARLFPRAHLGLWHGGLALAGAAALRAVLLDDRLRLTVDAGFGAPWGPWQAFATFALLVPVIALLFASAPEGASRVSRLVFLVGILFLGLWAFALFRTALLTTLYLALVGGVLAAAALARPGTAVSRDALAAGVALVVLSAAKGATLDVHDTRPQLALPLGLLETAITAGALLALYHVGAGRRLQIEERFASGALIGGAAAVVASAIFAYAGGAWVSVLLGALGVAFLATGFALRAHATYRYTGFAVLGFVVLRVFAVDLRETDLIVRAAVFAVLGAILLGVGYVYARASRKAEAEAAPADGLTR